MLWRDRRGARGSGLGSAFRWRVALWRGRRGCVQPAIFVQPDAVAGMPLGQQHDLSGVVAEMFVDVEYIVEDCLIEPLRPALALQGRVGRIGDQLSIEL